MDGLSVYGGLGMLYQTARNFGFHEAVDCGLNVLKINQGYSESDHLFNLLSGHFIGVGCIEDIAQLKDDSCYRQLLDGKDVTALSTMGGFMPRFKRSDLSDYKGAISSMQEQVWRKLTAEQRREASPDLDSRICQSRGHTWSSATHHPEVDASPGRLRLAVGGSNVRRSDFSVSTALAPQEDSRSGHQQHQGRRFGDFDILKARPDIHFGVCSAVGFRIPEPGAS